MEASYNGYPVYKGLQMPLEFMGIRHGLKSQALGPCFFSISANADNRNFNNYSGYSVIVEKVQKKEESNVKGNPKTMYVNGREYILR